MKPVIISVSGFTSDSGKTTLLCKLLREFPGWEAIKITRGHYRSCGKDPHACCVSHLLKDEPVIRSGRDQTYTPGKDTGRYWEAGATNVHWLIVSDQQVDQGIRLALERVRSPGVFIEGTSFLKYIDVDFALMAARSSANKIKPSARRALPKTSAIYLFDEFASASGQPHEGFCAWLETTPDAALLRELTVYSSRSFPDLITRLRSLPTLSRSN